MASKDKSGNLHTLDSLLREDGKKQVDGYADPKAGWAHELLRKVEVRKKQIARKDKNGQNLYEKEEVLDQKGFPVYEDGQKKMKDKVDKSGRKIQAFDLVAVYEEEVKMFDRKKFKKDSERYHQRLKAARDNESANGAIGGGAYAMTRRDQRAFDVENKIGRANKDADGNYLRADGKKAANATDLQGIQALRRNDKGQYVDSNDRVISDGDSLALASDYPYPG